jgi:methyl-accepting chemotaxis protein
MTRCLQIALATLALTVIIAVGAVGFAAYRALNQLADAGQKISAAADGVTSTLANINRSCGGSHPCGTLAEIGKATVKVGDILVTSQRQEQDTARAAQHTMAAVDQIATHADALTDSLAGTATAATGTLDAATDTLGEGKRTIAAAQPLLGHSDATMADLDGLLKRKSITDTLDNLSGITGHANGITGDAQRVSDDLTQRYFAPVPWWRKVGPFAEFGVKAGNKALGLW